MVLQMVDLIPTVYTLIKDHRAEDCGACSCVHNGVYPYAGNFAPNCQATMSNLATIDDLSQF